MDDNTKNELINLLAQSTLLAEPGEEGSAARVANHRDHLLLLKHKKLSREVDDIGMRRDCRSGLDTGLILGL